MHNKDFPVINRAIGSLRLQKKNPQLPILERLCLHSDSIHAFAGAYLALWHWLGYEPRGECPNKFKDAGIRLARDIRTDVIAGNGIDIIAIGVRRDILDICQIQQQVTSKAYLLHGESSYTDNPRISKSESDRRSERASKGKNYFPKARK